MTPPNLRRKVFVEEQGISEAIELDERDEYAYHLIAIRQRKTCGVMRILIEDNVAKLGRIAVHPGDRQQGIGSAMVQQSLRFCHLVGVDTLVLNAQSHTIRFYEKLGFKAEGETFLEAKIPHIRMTLSLEEKGNCELYLTGGSRDSLVLS